MRRYVLWCGLVLLLCGCGQVAATPDPRAQLLHEQIARYDVWYHDFNTRYAFSYGANHAPYEARRAQFTREYPLFGSYLAWWQSTYVARTNDHALGEFIAYVAEPSTLDDPVAIAAYLASH